MLALSHLSNNTRMATPKSRSLLFSLCSLFMASLFAYSASVQLNDPDWYFWFPLYASASVANLLPTKFASKNSDQLAKLVVGLGLFLHAKVSVEGCVLGGWASMWDWDMSKRVTREKMGSGLVLISMYLQLKAGNGRMGRQERSGKCIECGMGLLVAASLGLSAAFFVPRFGAVGMTSLN